MPRKKSHEGQETRGKGQEPEGFDPDETQAGGVGEVADADDRDDFEEEDFEEDFEEDESEGEAEEESDDGEFVPGEDYRAGYVAVVGKPNVGKSTLVNLYVGQKVSIVSPRPQTTRRRILGIATFTVAQIVFFDTPGIQQPKHNLGEYMVEHAISALPDADVILFVCDVSHPPDLADRRIAELLKREAKAPIILVLNKMDRLPPDRVIPHTEAYFNLVPHVGWMMLNAERGHNRDQLLELIVEQLPVSPPLFPVEQVTDQPMQVFAAEIIREKVMRHTYEEVPQGIAVLIDRWEERENGMLYLAAMIYVERESHKSIVIGAKGQMLKKIGQEARQELEADLGRRIFLELWVKVREKWRNNPFMLAELEYRRP